MTDKILKFLLFVGFALLIIGCNSDDNSNDNIQLTDSEALVNGSPWVYSRYEVIEIINRGNSEITKDAIIDDVNNDLVNVVLNFSEDGTGSVDVPNDNPDPFTWRITANNHLELKSSNGNDIQLWNNFNIINGVISFEFNSVTFDSVVSFEVLHNGRYFFE